MKIEVIRDVFLDNTTIGKMYIDGEYFGYTLEDCARAVGVKVQDKTCIAPSSYLVTVTMSSRFGRMMPLIYNTDDYRVVLHGVTFTGVRIHGGNSHENTSGCILVAARRYGDDKIQGSLEKELTALIQQAIASGEDVVLEVVNKP